MARIAFIWQDGHRYDWQWRDGLWAALNIIGKKHDVGYFAPWEQARISGFRPDMLMFWGAATDDYAKKIVSWPIKKALCFGGGPLSPELVHGWDVVFVESKVDQDALCKAQNRVIRAFGINEALFCPNRLPKRYGAVLAATFAAWKRHDLFAKTMKNAGVAIGIKQDHERWCYEVCLENGVRVFEELPREKIAEVLNQSYAALNTADANGGGQRFVLEAMACNVPPIVMSDAPKNCEFVEESGFGIICEPTVEAIKKALIDADNLTPIGREYIMRKWTSSHYAASLMDGIGAILNG